MAKLVIGFSRPKKWKPFAAAIMAWDRLRYKSDVPASHCYGKFTAGSWKRDFIYQAAGHATHFMGGVHFDTINVVVREYEIELPPQSVIEIGQVCVDREGKKYAVKQDIGIMLSALVWMVTFGRKVIKNIFADGDKETNCVEEWGRILCRELRVDAPFNLDTVSVKPFIDWVDSLPQAKRII